MFKQTVRYSYKNHIVIFHLWPDLHISALAAQEQLSPSLYRYSSKRPTRNCQCATGCPGPCIVRLSAVAPILANAQLEIVSVRLDIRCPAVSN